MGRAALTAAGAALAAALAAPCTAAAYVRSLVEGTDICVYWPVRTLPYWIHQAGTADVPGDAELPVIRTSFGSWSLAACTDLSFADRGLTADTRVGYARGEPPLNVVVFRPRLCADAAAGHACLTQGGCKNLFNCWERPDNGIALTTTTYSKRTGELFDADIELNEAARAFAILSAPCTGDFCKEDDLQNTVTHEVGHFIGFGHETDPTSVMFASAVPGETVKRRMNAGDVEGLCAVYPRGRPPLPCGTPGAREAVGSCGASGAVLLLTLVGSAATLPRSRGGDRARAAPSSPARTPGSAGGA